MKNFISVINWLVTDIFKNKDYPYFATIVFLTTYEVLTLLLIFDVTNYHFLNDRDIIVNDNRIIGTIIITLIFGFNYKFYQNKVGRYAVEFKNQNNSNKSVIKLFSILYLLSITGLTIYNAYLIRNNLKLF